MNRCDWCGEELSAGWCYVQNRRYHADCFMKAIAPIKKIKHYGSKKNTDPSLGGLQGENQTIQAAVSGDGEG